jgi:hypothetical protein
MALSTEAHWSTLMQAISWSSSGGLEDGLGEGGALGTATGLSMRLGTATFTFGLAVANGAGASLIEECL